MSEPDDFNPYKAPASAGYGIPESQAAGVLKDSWFIGKMALTAMVTSISRRQAEFCSPDASGSHRVMLRPLPPRRSPTIPGNRAGRIHPTPLAPNPNAGDIESGWGNS